MIWLAGVVVIAAGLWLIGLALAIVLTPDRAEHFLTQFASSARAHYTEQVLRLIAGCALVMFAAEMRFSDFFWIFGWLLVVTATALLLIPWKWHHRFGTWAIPLAIRNMKMQALGAFALGAFMLYAALLWVASLLP
jgi:hypothetical protein